MSGHEPNERHDAVDFERSELALGGVLLTLALIAASIGIVGLGAWSIVRGYGPSKSESARPDTYERPAASFPAAPRLELLDDSPDNDPLGFQRQMTHLLHSYGRTEQEGFVRVPIEEAIDRVAAQIKVKKDRGAGFNKRFGLLSGGEPNAGRLYQEAPSWFDISP